MKRLLIILAAIFSFAGIQAQYLNNGDVVSISFLANDARYYLEASGDGVLTKTSVSDDCLWEVQIDEQTNTYTFQDLTSGRYLSSIFTDPSNSAITLAQQPMAFSFTNTQSVADNYMYGKLYYSRYYEPWYMTLAMYLDCEWGGNGPFFTFHSWANTSIYIEKWEQKGAGKPTGHFSPSKIEFTYANEEEAAAQARPVSFEIEATTESYYQCKNRPEEALLLRSTGNVDGSSVSIKNIYWESSKVKTSTLHPTQYTKHANETERALLQLSEPTGGQDGVWQFTITPTGPSPMGLKQLIYKEQQNGQTVGIEQWVDYDDDVVVEYTYGNSEVQTAKMRVVRKAYHEEQLPALIFTINPATYTFATSAETKDFDLIAYHQHGTVIYNVDNQVISTTYEPGYEKTQVTITSQNLELELDNNWNSQLSANVVDGKIRVNAAVNETGNKRSAILTGTLCPIKEQGEHPCETFAIQLHQRGVDAGGIKFVHKRGAGNTAWGENTNIVGSDEERREQLVHTSERTIYYESGQPEVELRLPEAGYSGYMRWYDYETGGDPYYNYARGKASTSWVRSPRGFNDQVFSAINTPKDGTDATIQQEGYSHGLYSLNIADGGVLDEAEPYNPMPIIKGWTYNNAAEACHIIACDVSAYTDYEILPENYRTTGAQITQITEPTLSYRQLFHLRPASEMADTLAARNARGQYLEEYHYTAPAGKQILLSTEYRYRKYRSHLSELCYFYRDKDNTIQRITGDYVPTWKEDDQTIANPQYTAELDYLIVREDNYENTPTKTYTLTYPGIGYGGKDLLIAKFVVTFVDVEKYGPTNKTIITKQKIQNDYEIRRLFDFNYPADEYPDLERVTMDDGTVHLNNHLPWEQSTYGYVYPGKEEYKRGASQGTFPFYGEYSLVNEVKKDWAKGEQLGGKEEGFAIYIDGTMEPGLVASITADAHICEGQTMYCSAWLCNPTPAGWPGEGNPIFRCNVEGEKEGKWTNIETYFVGELLKGTGWQQVVFPIKSDESYDQVRVSIYNFATTNQGNDFMVDDICLYVSQLPIAAYRGEMACKSIDDAHTQGIAVLRIDYSKMEESSAGYIYYQIYNETSKDSVLLGGDNSGYYHDQHQHEEGAAEAHAHGSIKIPGAKHIPTQDSVRMSVTKLIDEFMASEDKHMKAYIKTTNDSVEKYLLYVAHKIEHTSNEKEAQTKLYEGHDYSMRMANTAAELSVPACNMQTPLHATQQTVFHLHNSRGDKQGEDFLHNSTNNCANDLYFLTIKVKNTLAAAGGGNLLGVEAPIYADWLVGDDWDDVYGQQNPTDDGLADADAAFAAKYGYTRGQVTAAIMYDMRRMPADGDNNSNYNAKSFEELDPNAFLSHQNYTIVKHLYDNGWLQFYNTTVNFYLGSDLTARYWAFPIEGTAKTKIEEQTYTLQDCNEPRWVTVSSKSSSYELNISPLLKADKNAQQKLQIPSIKVPVSKLQNAIIPIKEIANVMVNNVSSGNITLDLTNPGTDFSYFDLATGSVLDGVLELAAGTKHTIRLKMNTLEGGERDGECLVGYVFTDIEILPATMLWTPSGETFNGWGKNENWKGWSDTNGDGKVQNSELTEGFVPTSDVNVVIPKLDNPLLYPYIVPQHEHSHYPMTVGFQPHHCKNIYFETGAKIHNQHLLHYEKAFVDMQITAGKWNMMSAPLKKMVSGDMFIPHTGKYNEGGALIAEPNPFEVRAFQGLRHRDAAYLFYQHFYNQTVYSHYEDGGTTSAASIGFEESNSLSQPLQAGGGYSLYGVGMVGKETLTIRLPKPDTEYYYYTSTGVQSTNKTSVDRGENNESYRLAFDAPHDAEHENQKMEIPLTNHTATDRFLFGNPTMAYIDMKLFLKTNSAVLNPVFHRIEGSVWTASTELSMHEDRYLAPMTSVLLETKDKTAQSAIKVTLSAEHLTLNNTVNTIAEEPENDTQRLIASSPDNHTSELLTIYAFTPKATARTVLASNPVANDYFVQGEDALFVSSGIENNTSVKSPLNMYTVAEQVPMMADVRQGISQIPLAILADTKARADYMQLAFYSTPNWTRECYLLDSHTGQKIRIMNGLIISVEMPQNHEQRYFIQGPDEYIGSNDNPGGGVTTSTSTLTPMDKLSLNAFSVNANELVVTASTLMREVKIYDMTGRLIADKVLDLLHNSTTLAAPSGICIVEAILRDGTSLHTQTLVR